MVFYKLKISTSNLVSLKAFDNLLLSFNTLFKIVILPKRLKRFVVLKSPHVNSKSKEHFQIKSHYRLYYISLSQLGFSKILTKIPNDVNINMKRIRF